VPPGGWTGRAIALRVLERVDDGAYANLALAEQLAELDRRRLTDDREKGFATELLYGTVRMRRACDWLVQAHISREPDDATLRVLHLGAYQLCFTRIPAHAAVRETVALAPEWSRGFVNAVLRNLARTGSDVSWPDLATELSYPDWIVEELTAALGAERAQAALRAMNEPAVVTTRDDGYVQDPASTAVAALVDARPGERILDLCAAPGGKATALAGAGAVVTAVELHEHRGALLRRNVERLGLTERIEVMVADARELHLGPTFDAVLVDAPCSGLGSLRRRPDARWRMQPEDLSELVALQHELLDVAVRHVRPGGRVVYSVCTLTDVETAELDAWVQRTHPELRSFDGVPDGWERFGRGARIIPAATDGMTAYRYEVIEDADGDERVAGSD
jgi:16S rRNA (cytosine967-C5)-methyltransferase